MFQKSKTCFRSDGEPFTEYGSRSEAQEGADYAQSQFGNEGLAPYSCETCGYFHIGPKDRAPNRTCPECTSEEGVSKDIYKTELDAMRMVEMKRRRGVMLRTYECPVGNGWHLTKM